MSMTAFELEQDIMKCWSVTDDIAEIAEDLESGHIDPAGAAEALRAYQSVYSRRFEKCFARFEQFNQEVWQERQDRDLDEPKNPADSKGKMAKSKGQKAVDQ